MVITITFETDKDAKEFGESYQEWLDDPERKSFLLWETNELGEKVWHKPSDR